MSMNICLGQILDRSDIGQVRYWKIFKCDMVSNSISGYKNCNPENVIQIQIQRSI